MLHGVLVTVVNLASITCKLMLTDVKYDLHCCTFLAGNCLATRVFLGGK